MSGNIATIANLNQGEVLDVFTDPNSNEKRITAKEKPESAWFFDITRVFKFADTLFEINKVIQDEMENPKIIAQALSNIEVRVLHFNNKLCNIVRAVFKLIASIFGYDLDKAYNDLVATLRQKHIEAIVEMAIREYDDDIHGFYTSNGVKIAPSSEEFKKIFCIKEYYKDIFNSNHDFYSTDDGVALDWTNPKFVEEFDDLFKLHYGCIDMLLNNFDEVYKKVMDSHRNENGGLDFEISPEAALLGPESIIFTELEAFSNLYRCARGFSTTLPNVRTVDPSILNHPDDPRVLTFYEKGTDQYEWREMYNELVSNLRVRFRLSEMMKLNKDYADLLEIDEGPQSFDL